jgi:hypothetical protein
MELRKRGDAQLRGERRQSPLRRADPLPSEINGCPCQFLAQRSAADSIACLQHDARRAACCQGARRLQSRQAGTDNDRVRWTISNATGVVGVHAGRFLGG